MILDLVLRVLLLVFWPPARLHGWLRDRLEARRTARRLAKKLPRGTVVRVFETTQCNCSKDLGGRDWAIACWNDDAGDYSLRGLSEDGTQASFSFGMEYACDRVKLVPTGRVVFVRN